MSVSDQEVRSEVAEARESLQMIRASLRTGMVIRFVGLVAGIIIVVIYVYSFMGLADRVARSGRIEQAVKERVELLNVHQGVQQIIREAGPVYMEEVRQVLSEMGLGEMLSTQLRGAYEDLRPVLLEEFSRVRPRLAEALRGQLQRTAAQLEVELQEMVEARMAQIIRDRQASLAAEADVSEEDVEKFLVNMIDANQQALMSVIDRRWAGSEQDLYEIRDMAAQLPELPAMDDQALLDHTVRVLVALLKYKLPDYEFTPATDITPAAQAPQPGPPRMGVDLSKVPEQYRDRVREAIRGAQRAAAEAIAPETGVDLSNIPLQFQDRVREAILNARQAAAQAVPPETGVDLSHVPEQYRDRVREAIRAARAGVPEVQLDLSNVPEQYRDRVREAIRMARQPAAQAAPPETGVDLSKVPEQYRDRVREAIRNAQQAAARGVAPETGLDLSAIPEEHRGEVERSLREAGVIE